VQTLKRMHICLRFSSDHRLARRGFRPLSTLDRGHGAISVPRRGGPCRLFAPVIEDVNCGRFGLLSQSTYRQLAAEEVALAEMAVTNESRAHHYAMAAYYLRLAEAKEKLARTNDVLSGDTDGDGGLEKFR
jgi:hypothetical protein